jgi:hypothetical protein
VSTEPLPIRFDTENQGARFSEFLAALAARFPGLPSPAARVLAFMEAEAGQSNSRSTPERPARGAYDGPAQARAIRLTDEQREVFERAVAHFRAMEPDMSEGRVVELLAAEFLSGL